MLILFDITNQRELLKSNEEIKPPTLKSIARVFENIQSNEFK